MFKPLFKLDFEIINKLIKIELIKEEINNLPLTPTVLSSLRETTHLSSTHYSTLIEGNRLTEEEVAKVIKENKHFPGKERDEKEILGYYIALDYVEKLAKRQKIINEQDIQYLHALIMSGGEKKVKPTIYRDGQNVIKDSLTRKIVYLPPEAKDVSKLMQDLVFWINDSKDIPIPVKAAIIHYQFATIHPYYDGNGRTARLLTTLFLHMNGYDLKGIYSLDEYYAQKLGDYYEALSVGPSHNYYMGRAESDITSWILYFISGMLESFDKVKNNAIKASLNKEKDHSLILRDLNPKQRAILSFFKKNKKITTKDIANFFKIKQNSARNIATKWVKEGFLVISNFSRKNRYYELEPNLEKILIS